MMPLSSMLPRPVRRMGFGAVLLLLAALRCVVYGAEPAASTAIVVVDAAGQTISLPKPPERIVVAGRAPFIPLHLLYMFPEAGKRLVGYEKRGNSEDAFLSFIDPDFKDKTTMGANPGPEQIAALHPDIVVARGASIDAMVKTLGTLNIPVCLLSLEDPDRFLEDVRTLGKLIGMESRADAIIDFYRTRLDRIDGAVGGIPEAERPGGLVVEYSQRGGATTVKAPGNGWMQTIQLQRAGGRPIWLDDLRRQSGWQMVGFEQIAAWNPDFISVVVWYELDACDVLTHLTAHPNWQRLTAVNENRLYVFPTDIYGWDTPDPRWILGMQWMASKLHPDRFSPVLDIRGEVVSFFNQLYGLPVSTINERILPKVRLDPCR